MPNIQLQFRRGTALEWSTENPTLAVGEMGIEIDTKLFKIGDGNTAWNSLSYGGLRGARGQGFPAGGTAGQVLSKINSDDYNIDWVDQAIVDLGAVGENILPTTDIAYDIGSPTKRFRDLYLSTNT
jgi:hypothetical protein